MLTEPLMKNDFQIKCFYYEPVISKKGVKSQPKTSENSYGQELKMGGGVLVPVEC